MQQVQITSSTLWNDAAPFASMQKPKDIWQQGAAACRENLHFLKIIPPHPFDLSTSAMTQHF